jgi:hypothetical protein
MTRLRQMMLEELQRRNYSEITTRKISMHVHRFFLTCPLLATPGCAPARRCIRVLASSKPPSLRLSNSLASGFLLAD